MSRTLPAAHLATAAPALAPAPAEACAPCAVGDPTITVMGVGPGAATIELVEGRLPTQPTECAVGAGVAAMWGSEVGGEIILVDAATTGVLYEVVGTFESPSDILTNDLVVMTAGEAAFFLGLEGRLLRHQRW